MENKKLYSVGLLEQTGASQILLYLYLKQNKPINITELTENITASRETILRTVWGYNVFPTTRTIDNFLLNIRKYFEEDSRNPQYFHSIS